MCRSDRREHRGRRRGWHSRTRYTADNPNYIVIVVQDDEKKRLSRKLIKYMDGKGYTTNSFKIYEHLCGINALRRAGRVELASP